jgi:hypothetical protein
MSWLVSWNFILSKHVVMRQKLIIFWCSKFLLTLLRLNPLNFANRVLQGLFQMLQHVFFVMLQWQFLDIVAAWVIPPMEELELFVTFLDLIEGVPSSSRALPCSNEWGRWSHVKENSRKCRASYIMVDLLQMFLKLVLTIFYMLHELFCLIISINVQCCNKIIDYLWVSW